MLTTTILQNKLTCRVAITEIRQSSFVSLSCSPPQPCALNGQALHGRARNVTTFTVGMHTDSHLHANIFQFVFIILGLTSSNAFMYSARAPICATHKCFYSKFVHLS